MARETDMRLYGRRKSRPLKPRQRRLVRELLPRLRVAPRENEKALREPGALFSPPRARVALEIGFGGGEHLARLARQRRDWGFIGCEPFLNGVAKLLVAIEEEGLDNIRLHDGDARALLPAIGEATLDAVYLLYPDPWPKKRHHKRRFVNQHTLAEIHRVLKPEGVFFFASDIDDYVAWTLAHVFRHGGFAWRARQPGDWRVPPPGWRPTRYEEKARREGRGCTYLLFERR